MLLLRGPLTSLAIDPGVMIGHSCLLLLLLLRVAPESILGAVCLADSRSELSARLVRLWLLLLLIGLGVLLADSILI